MRYRKIIFSTNQMIRKLRHKNSEITRHTTVDVNQIRLNCATDDKYNQWNQLNTKKKRKSHVIVTRSKHVWHMLPSYHLIDPHFTYN